MVNVEKKKSFIFNLAKILFNLLAMKNMKTDHDQSNDYRCSLVVKVNTKYCVQKRVEFLFRLIKTIFLLKQYMAVNLNYKFIALTLSVGYICEVPV